MTNSDFTIIRDTDAIGKFLELMFKVNGECRKYKLFLQLNRHQLIAVSIGFLYLLSFEGISNARNS